MKLVRVTRDSSGIVGQTRLAVYNQMSADVHYIIDTMVEGPVQQQIPDQIHDHIINILWDSVK